MADFSVVSHPQRPQIDAMILGGLSLREIAKSVSPAVSPAALHRYKTAAKREIAKQRGDTVTSSAAKSINITDIAVPPQAEQRGSPASFIPPQATRSPLIERAEKLYARIDKAMDQGELAVRTVMDDDTQELVAVGHDLRVLPPLFREANNGLRLIGELTGELNQAAAQAASITINIVQNVGDAKQSAYDLEIKAEPQEIGQEIAQNQV